MCEHTKGHHVEELLKSQFAAQLQSVAGLHVAVCCSVLQYMYEHNKEHHAVDSKVSSLLSCSVLQCVAVYV